MGYMLICIACIVPSSMRVSDGIKEKYPSLGTTGMYGAKYASILDTNPFFHGDTCGIVDCSLYGLLEPFRKTNNACYHEFMAASPSLQFWHARMKEEIPKF